MTLRFLQSDNYTSICDNLSCLPRIHRGTASQFADSTQNPKYISSADNSSLRLTLALILTAFIKTTYNKVSGQLLSRFSVAQTQTAAQNVVRQILLYFSSRFLSPPLHIAVLVPARVKEQMRETSSKIRAKKFINLTTIERNEFSMWVFLFYSILHNKTN